MKVSHRDWISWRWGVPVEIFPLCRNCGEGQSGWGWGAVHCVPIPSPHPDPCLSNKRRIGCNEVLQCRPCFDRPSAPVLLDPRLDLAAEGMGAPLVLPLARHNNGVNETLGIRRDPCLAVAFPPRCPGNGPPYLRKHAVYPVRDRHIPDG